MIKVIAEIGSNWDKDTNWEELVALTKETGADAIKFQHFTTSELYGLARSKVDKYALEIGFLEYLKGICDLADIEFMCSAFSIEGYERIDPLVKTHKIASSESTWLDLVDEVSRLEKDVILSVGGLSRCMLKYYVDDFFSFYKHNNLTLLYCDPTYPSNKTVHAIENGISLLLNYGVDVGYSDHTTEPLFRLNAPVSVVEKHYNPLALPKTPDSPHSLKHDDMVKYVKSIREFEKSPDNPMTYNPHRRVKTDKGWFRPYNP